MGLLERGESARAIECSRGPRDTDVAELPRTWRRLHRMPTRSSTYRAFPSRTTLIRNATVMTAAGPTIERLSAAERRKDRRGRRQPRRAFLMRSLWTAPVIRHTGTDRHALAPWRVSAPGTSGNNDGNEAPVRSPRTYGPSIRCGRRTLVPAQPGWRHHGAAGASGFRQSHRRSQRRAEGPVRTFRMKFPAPSTV